ncbi:putative MFS glucose transporter [Kalaharituber pfeilii]|nr:putative MFS glucose transporter [Kalaharituber pfeilii]
MLPFALWYSLGSAAIAPLLFGYHMGELNAPEAAIRCPSNAIVNAAIDALALPPCIPMSTSDFGLVTSIFAFGGLGGALLGGPLSNKYGRRGTLLICAIGFMLGGLIMTFSGRLFGMLSGRLVSGISSGAAVVVTPLYVYELAPASSTGSFGAITQISVNVGILLTQSLGLFLSKESIWRLILAVGAVLGGAQFILLLRAEESPKWLAANGKQEEAEAALQRVRGGNLSFTDIRDSLSDDHHGSADEEEPLISDDGVRPQSSLKSKEKVSLYQFLTLPTYRKPLIAVIGVMFVQQLTGINAIIMYGVSVLRELISGSGPALINVFISATNLFFTWYASRYFDRAGRKPYLLASIAGLGINSLALGFGIIFHVPVLSAIATILFVSSFSIGLGPIPWMVAAETVPFNASGAAQSISLAANWIGTFMVSYGFPVLAATGIGKGGMFLVFAVIAAFGGLFVLTFIPETKGVGVEEAWKNHDKKVTERWDWLTGKGRATRESRVD